MPDDAKEKCGVLGVYSMNGASPEVPFNIFDGLMALQHRGQESAGITVVGSDGMLHSKKAMGLVSHIFTYSDLEALPAKVGIGHVRYSTTGSSTIENAQPLVGDVGKLQIAISFNGNIVNYEELKRGLESMQHAFSCSADTELIVRLYAIELSALGKQAFSFDDHFTALRKVMGKLEGAYSIIMLLSDGTMVAFRDPAGFKPLSIGRKTTLVSDFMLVSSETCAIDAIGASYDRELLPGEAFIIKGGKTETRVLIEKPKAHCVFEYAYFSRPDSIFNGRSIYEVRKRLGMELATLFKGQADVVVPVPDSGRSAAEGFAQATGIPLVEGLIKNRYVHRTFIMPSDAQRKSQLQLKLNPIPAAIKGKRVALVDDSIVRGNTMRQIVKMLRAAGAAEVHLLISFPPVIAPCYMGIDFPTYSELLAANKTQDAIKGELGADSVTYVTPDGIQRAIGLPKEDLCWGCTTDIYPTSAINDYARERKKKEKSFNIAVFVTGRGTNLQSIIDAVEKKRLSANLALVFSDKENAPALERARKHGIEKLFLDSKDYSGKEEFEKEIIKYLEKKSVDLIVLAGYMRIIGPALMQAYHNKIINIHPTLLPKFKGCAGMACHEAVIKAKEKESGCTVHFVTEDVDGGPILAQAKVPVLEGDTPEKLAERVLKEEHLLLVEVIRDFCEGKGRGC